MQPKLFFQFDELYHYRIEIDAEALEALEFKKRKTTVEQLCCTVLFDELHPKDIFDIAFIESLEKLNFKKNKVVKNEFEIINSIFSVKKVETIQPTYCGAVFRDILVFYEKQHITGLAKLCFSCGHHVIVGTDDDTTFFGQQGDYAILYKLLNVKLV